MTPQLQKKVDFAIRLLQSIPQDSPIEISYSGGKDSDVILELAKMAGISYRAIYKNTTIDIPYTIKHCKDNNVEIFAPEKTFFQIVRENGLPSRFKRFCCKYLKEYKVLDRAVQGIRRSESVKRSQRYHEPEVCRIYSKDEKVKVYLPILEWTDEDVTEFIVKRGIKCHPLYYDKYGNFDVTKRLGCIGCCLASPKKRLEQFMQYPKMLKLWISNFQYWLDNHPDSKQYLNSNGSAYNKMFFDLFCRSKYQCDSLLGGVCSLKLQ